MQTPMAGVKPGPYDGMAICGITTWNVDRDPVVRATSTHVTRRGAFRGLPPVPTPAAQVRHFQRAQSRGPDGRRTLVNARKSLALLSVVLASGLVLAAWGGGGASAGGDSYAWDFTITTGNTSTWPGGAELFAEQVEEKSDG